jgi:serpin B
VAKPASSAEANAVTAGLNAFSIALYKATPRRGNAVLSPFSVAMALSLVELGARNASAKALHELLGASSAEAYRADLAGLVEKLSGGGPTVDRYGTAAQPHQLKLGNSLWIARGYSLTPSFVPLAERTYQAVARPLEVSKAVAAARQINAWVSEATNGKIKKIVLPSTITRLTRLILVNAVHFIGRWREPFNERLTQPAPFHVDGREKTTLVPTMFNTAAFRVIADEQVTVLELPYWGDGKAELAMALVLPKARDGLAALEARLSLARLEGWVKALRSQRVAVALPRFKAEASFRLEQVLRDLGLDQLFSAKAADLSGISPERGLHLSAVVHKTYIKVDEKGTEAAAATAITGKGAGAPAEPLEFRADHPFLYFIRDTKSGTLLFVGRVTDPR